MVVLKELSANHTIPHFLKFILIFFSPYFFLVISYLIVCNTSFKVLYFKCHTTQWLMTIGIFLLQLTQFPLNLLTNSIPRVNHSPKCVFRTVCHWALWWPLQMDFQNWIFFNYYFFYCSGFCHTLKWNSPIWFAWQGKKKSHNSFTYSVLEQLIPIANAIGLSLLLLFHTNFEIHHFF